MKHAVYNVANLQDTVRQLYGGQPDILALTSPATALLEMQIPHGLGRLPKGFSVLSGDTGPIATPAPSKVIVASDANALTGDVFSADTGHYVGTVEGSFLSPSNSATEGFVCPRAGSITAISFFAVITGAGTGNGVITVQARKNGSNVYSVSSAALASTGTKKAYGTAAQGTYAFAAGDIISPYHALAFTGTPPTTSNIVSWIELSYSGGGASTPFAQAGPTPWDANFIYLKFAAASAGVTVAVW
jgi:hypothetical protein